MMCARSVMRSSKALQRRGFGNTCVHSENGKLVVTIKHCVPSHEYNAQSNVVNTRHCDFHHSRLFDPPVK